jgi:uncharacterized protein YndB with AHSA1/START domain/mannose-6-phosphate isomerase-like protein (cupin superfamily)
MPSEGELLDFGPLGVRVQIRQCTAEVLEYDVTGRPRGLIVQEHVHVGLVERHEVLSGAMKLVLDGRQHELHPGDAMEIPAGMPHRQLPAGTANGLVRVRMSPPGRTLDFLRRLAELVRERQINRLGFPRPGAGARLVLEFADEGRASHPSEHVQRRVARSVLAGANAARGVAGAFRTVWRRSQREYRFVDEWDVAAPPDPVFAALADARTYPQWWTPVYLDVDAEGPPMLGKESRQHFKGRLPYHLHTRSRIVEYEPPRLVAGEVDGDLRGRGVWTLTPTASGTHVRFDWRVHADRTLLRGLTPILRPALRWNHDWAIGRAIAGLEPYAQAHPVEAHPSDSIAPAGASSG